MVALKGEQFFLLIAVCFLAAAISLSLKYKHCCNKIIKLPLGGMAIKRQLAGYWHQHTVVRLTNHKQGFQQIGLTDWHVTAQAGGPILIRTVSQPGYNQTRTLKQAPDWCIMVQETSPCHDVGGCFFPQLSGASYTLKEASDNQQPYSLSDFWA